MAATPDGGGYWEVASDGGIFAFGDAGFVGSQGGRPLNAPIVGMAVSPSGRGYWLVASDGGIFSFGDAGFWGSTGGQNLNKAVVGMAPTPDGGGYWEVASDGGIFAFGDAHFGGSTGSLQLDRPMVGMAPAPDGYWEVASDGGIFSQGGAPFLGSVPELPTPGVSRIALYGDSLVSESAQDFQFFANLSGASTLVRTYPGTAPCDWLATMAADVQGWQPSVAVLVFSGDDFSPCMAGDSLGTPQYYAKYRMDMQSAISIFRAVGDRVVLVGLPLDASSLLSQNASALNQIYQSLAQGNAGVTYDDAGQAVMANGQFTWTLPCLSVEPCTGTNGTNIVRAPDGVHFCPDGNTTLVAGFEECDVYSSGAYRFALAMLAPAPPTRPLVEPGHHFRDEDQPRHWTRSVTVPSAEDPAGREPERGKGLTFEERLAAESKRKGRDQLLIAVQKTSVADCVHDVALHTCHLGPGLDATAGGARGWSACDRVHCLHSWARGSRLSKARHPPGLSRFARGTGQYVSDRNRHRSKMNWATWPPMMARSARGLPSCPAAPWIHRTPSAPGLSRATSSIGGDGSTPMVR